ncbi:hypothetical protein P9112_012129 [Eukaryota sp. TZLM1-RC]
MVTKKHNVLSPHDPKINTLIHDFVNNPVDALLQHWSNVGDPIRVFCKAIRTIQYLIESDHDQDFVISLIASHLLLLDRTSFSPNEFMGTLIPFGLDCPLSMSSWDNFYKTVVQCHRGNKSYDELIPMVASLEHREIFYQVLFSRYPFNLISVKTLKQFSNPSLELLIIVLSSVDEWPLPKRRVTEHYEVWSLYELFVEKVNNLDESNRLYYLDIAFNWKRPAKLSPNSSIIVDFKSSPDFKTTWNILLFGLGRLVWDEIKQFVNESNETILKHWINSK